jgi:hypothetical protein
MILFVLQFCDDVVHKSCLRYLVMKQRPSWRYLQFVLQAVLVMKMYCDACIFSGTCC